MSDDTPNVDPIVYLSRQNGKRIAVCLSNFGKWVAGIFATLFTAGFLATFSLIWSSADNSKAAVVEIRHLRETIDRYEKENDEAHSRFTRHIEEGHST